MKTERLRGRKKSFLLDNRSTSPMTSYIVGCVATTPDIDFEFGSINFKWRQRALRLSADLKRGEEIMDLEAQQKHIISPKQ
jgi:hypothetical protein